ncbi:hypothetical protein [Nonomuraea africana]|uniref:Uncharacterized protein n=1 Tax=Nonomuraea africana TaxID=46171 RepID=A0ABR9KCJ1_9ACTN|nr:hypothetical protein [Nonomuraea africana]MBE1559724.1 hypothetical protein [Nonomuraea africana]
MGNDGILCQVCQGVLPASGRDAYTPARGRLIVTNGYCEGGCAERVASRQRPMEAPVRQQQPPAAAPQAPAVRVLTS